MEREVGSLGGSRGPRGWRRWSRSGWWSRRRCAARGCSSRRTCSCPGGALAWTVARSPLERVDYLLRGVRVPDGDAPGRARLSRRGAGRRAGSLASWRRWRWWRGCWRAAGGRRVPAHARSRPRRRPPRAGQQPRQARTRRRRPLARHLPGARRAGRSWRATGPVPGLTALRAARVLAERRGRRAGRDLPPHRGAGPALRGVRRGPTASSATRAFLAAGARLVAACSWRPTTARSPRSSPLRGRPAGEDGPSDGRRGHDRAAARERAASRPEPDLLVDRRRRQRLLDLGGDRGSARGSW